MNGINYSLVVVWKPLWDLKKVLFFTGLPSDMEAEVSEINAHNLWGQVYAVSSTFSFAFLFKILNVSRRSKKWQSCVGFLTVD